MYIRSGLLAILFLFGMLAAVQGGYQLGVSAENTTELNESIREIQTNYSETAEENLTVESYSELENKTEYKAVRPLEKTYYNTVIRPVYWFGRGMLETAGIVIEASARLSYRYL